MEILRKRRASAEVEHLMTAVKTDYEFFASFDAIFETPSPAVKRQRSLSDALFDYTTRNRDSMAPSKTIHGDRNSWCMEDVCQTLSSETSESKLARHAGSRLPSPPELRLISSQSPSGQIKSSCWSVTRIGSPTSFPRHHSWPTGIKTPAQDILSPALRPSVPSSPAYAQNNSAEHFEHIFDKISPQSQDVEIPHEAPRLGVSARRYSLEKDGIQILTARRRSDEDVPIKLTTRITYGGPPSETRVYNTPPKFRRISVDEHAKKRNTMLINREKPDESGVGKRSVEGSLQSPAKEMMIVEQTKPSIQRQLSADASPMYSKPSNQSSPLVQVDNHVGTSPTNEGDEVITLGTRNLHELQHPKLEDDHILPNYIITRVGSLLWLDKDMVYPISLEEIQRRVKDPENFSFQMLIAYVRHSRAKGRQFLNYWKCQPTGKTSNPNVLSKLCEADTKELVDGIQRVNEEYFPGEKVAQNAAESIFKDVRNAPGDVAAVVPQELQEKVEKIEKSRSVFRTLAKTLSSTENDEKFEMFNIASHNAGLTNIKNNLRFLDGILAKIQTHINRGERNVAPFIGEIKPTQ